MQRYNLVCAESDGHFILSNGIAPVCSQSVRILALEENQSRIGFPWVRFRLVLTDEW